MANKSTSIKVVIGPTEPVPGNIRANPADLLRTGPVPTRTFTNMTTSRPFKYPTKSALHRNEGLSNEEVNQPYCPEDVGMDHNKYSHGPNDAETLQGEPIRGT